MKITYTQNSLLRSKAIEYSAMLLGYWNMEMKTMCKLVYYYNVLEMIKVAIIEEFDTDCAGKDNWFSNVTFEGSIETRSSTN